jgi:hypothetical protein
MMRQKTITELESQVARLQEELPRARSLHAEAEARLVSLRRELSEIDGS